MPPDHSWLGIITALAGPIATICAASAAVFVTHRLGTRQLAIAQAQTAIADEQRKIAIAQRDVAYDRLKYDLFQKRYELNDMLRKLFECLGRCTDPANDTDISMMRFRIRTEPRYFFPKDVADKFREFESVVQQYLRAQMTRDQYGEQEKERRDEAAKMGQAVLQLLDMLENIHRMMGDELVFSQLTTRRL
jgi:hypothetical protein